MKGLMLPNYVRREGAHFEKKEIFLKNAITVNSTSRDLEAAGVPMLRLDQNTYALSKKDVHAFIIGDTGCGKTRRIIMPSIVMLSKTGESMVISDPKGELYKHTSNILRERGYEVQVLNFRVPRRGNRWNPLSIIEDMYRSGDPDEHEKSVIMLKDIVDILKNTVHSERDAYWENNAGDVFLGISYVLLEYGEKGSLTFENIAYASKELFEELVDKKGLRVKTFLNKLPQNSPIVNCLKSIVNLTATDTRSCVISIFENMMAPYTSQSALRDLFSASEIDVNDLGRKRTAIFFILPDDSAALYPIATVFVKQIYSTLVNLADSYDNGELPNRVSFILDEFANFARIPSCEAMLTAARSRGIRFMLVCQSMEQLQLKEKYGQEGAEILMSNCRLWIYMSCRDLNFLNRLERLMGEYVSPYTNDRYPLVSVSELQHFELGEVLVFNDRCSAMRGFLPDFTEYNFGELPKERISALPEKRPPRKADPFKFLDLCYSIASGTRSAEGYSDRMKLERDEFGAEETEDGQAQSGESQARTESRRQDRSARSLRDAIERYSREEAGKKSSSDIPEWVMPTEPDEDGSGDGSAEDRLTDTSKFIEELFSVIDPEFNDDPDDEDDDIDDGGDDDGGNDEWN